MKKIKKGLEKMQLWAILIVLLAPCFIVSGAEDNSDSVPERSSRVNLTVTLHGVDTTGNQKLANAENLLKDYQRRKELELTELRHKIIELQRQQTVLEQKCQGLQMRIADLFGNGIMSQDSKGLSDTCRLAYGELRVKSRNLLVSSNRIVSLLGEILENGLPQNATQMQRMQAEIQQFQDRIGEVDVLLNPKRGKVIQGCKVLEINANEQIVVLNQGYNQGIIPGMSMWIEEGAVITELYVIEVRADIAAAILMQGDWRSIVPGKAVTAGRKKQQSE